MKKSFESKECDYEGAAWFDPSTRSFYAGTIKEDSGVFMGELGKRFEGGILTDVSTIEAKVVLEELLGLYHPDYVLDQCCRIVSAPEVVLEVDVETVGSGQRGLKPLQESEVVGKTFSRYHFECELNEHHIVVEDRAAKKSSHDVLKYNIENAARDIQYMRELDINTVLLGATEIAGVDWGLMTTPPNSDFNPMPTLTSAITTINCTGKLPVDYVALNPLNWAEFLSNTYIAPLVQAGIMTIKGTPTVTLPGWPSIKVLLDCNITANSAVVGNRNSTILAMGPTEAVKYRNELKRYTGYLSLIHI